MVVSRHSSSVSIDGRHSAAVGAVATPAPCPASLGQCWGYMCESGSSSDSSSPPACWVAVRLLLAPLSITLVAGMADCCCLFAAPRVHAGAALELSTIMAPHMFLPLACSANLAKNLAAVAASSTRAPIYRTFALQNNLVGVGKGECWRQLTPVNTLLRVMATELLLLLGQPHHPQCL